jgi:WD40 repeat protein
MGLASRSGQLVDVAGEGPSGRVEVRNPRTLAVERSFPFPQLQFSFTYVAVNPDATVAAVTWQSVSSGLRHVPMLFVDLEDGSVRVGVGGQGGDRVVFSPDGTSLASADGSNVLLWNVETGAVTETLSGHAGGLNDLAFDAQGRTLYASGVDGTVLAYDLSGGRGFAHRLTADSGNRILQGGFANVSASPAGNQIAVSESGGVVRIVDVITGREEASFVAIPGGEVQYAKFSPDGKKIVVVGEPGDVSLWQLGPSSPVLIRRFRGLARERTRGIGAGTFSPGGWATFSPDGQWIVGNSGSAIVKDNDYAGSIDRLIAWDSTTGERRAPPLDLPMQGGSTNVVFSPDGALLVTAVDTDVQVIDAATLTVQRHFLADEQGVAWVAMSPDSAMLATGGFDGVVQLWSTRTWRPIGKPVVVVAGQVHSVEFDPTGRVLIATSSGGRSNLWSVPEMVQIGPDLVPSFTGIGGWSTSTLASQGSTLVVVFADGEAFTWPATVEAWRAAACDIAGRNLSPEEWAIFVPDRSYEKTCPQFP